MLRQDLLAVNQVSVDSPGCSKETGVNSAPIFGPNNPNALRTMISTCAEIVHKEKADVSTPASDTAYWGKATAYFRGDQQHGLRR